MTLIISSNSNVSHRIILNLILQKLSFGFAPLSVPLAGLDLASGKIHVGPSLITLLLLKYWPLGGHTMTSPAHLQERLKSIALLEDLAV